MLSDGVLLFLIIGWACGGRLAGLADITLRKFWLIPVALLLRAGPVFLAGSGVEMAIRYGSTAQVIGYLLLFVALYLNRDLPGMPLLALGVALNFLVIALNQGRMPVSPWGIQVTKMHNMLPALTSGAYTSHSLLTESTRLPWLADIIPIPRPYPIRKIISIGDIVMVLGVGQLIMLSMLNARSPQPTARGVDSRTTLGD
ncbi:MAG: DUF5317 domain-containing protein [Bacillota bacterium]